MFTEAELRDALNELESGRHTIQNCEKMAAIYTVLDHAHPPERGYSMDARAEGVGLYGKSQFLRAIAGKPTEDAWLLIDELVEAVSVLQPKLYNNFLEKVQEL